MVRYPHSAIIILDGETKNGDGDFVSAPIEIVIEKGRFEPNSNKGANVDYAGKFYCPLLLEYSPFELMGKKLKYNGIEMEIYQFQNFQIHCELWLK